MNTRSANDLMEEEEHLNGMAIFYLFFLLLMLCWDNIISTGFHPHIDFDECADMHVLV